MKIAILGATSQIAKDLILSFSYNKSYQLTLFGRSIQVIEAWKSRVNLNKDYQVKHYSAFNAKQHYDVVINFVGVGDPAKIQTLGEKIVDITEYYDNLALDYIKNNSETKYIFLSSGVVFGSDYQAPVDKNTIIKMSASNLTPMDWYVSAKQHAESKHRALPNLSIVDIRVFNYFSHTQDAGSRLLMSDIVRAIVGGHLFKTSSDNIVKDFVVPSDFYNLVQAIIDYRPMNQALDCYTLAPVAKFDLLDKLRKEFGLQYKIDQSADIVDTAKVKMKYYSVNKAAEKVGYTPKFSSLDGIVQEIYKYLSK